MNEKLMQQMREVLLDYYGMDIKEAECKFSTQNYAFIFPGKPYMIRVSMTPKKSREEIISELMWVDDLKQFKQTICEPSTSLRNKIIEEFVIDGITYRASMFRTARGNVQTVTEVKPMFFICVGELLGTIHKASEDEQRLGIHYKRKTLKEDFDWRWNRLRDRFDKDIQDKIEGIVNEIEALPKDVGVYGLCHGDFHLANFFVETNNIWLFDFDSCIYAHYLLDVAVFIVDILQRGYMHGKNFRKLISEDILPYLKIGYSLNKECSENYWDKLELFINYRVALSVIALQEIEDCGVVNDMESIRAFYNRVLEADNILDAMSEMSKGTN